MSNTNQNSKKEFQLRRKKSDQGADLGAFVFGKVQPQAMALEEAVLGAIMLDKDALPVIIDILSKESFYTE